MIEAYQIGVRIGMSGNVAQVIEKLVKQFATLDEAIKRTQGEVKNLASAMSSIAREGRDAAAAWTQAANAMARAASSAKRAQGSMPNAASAAAGAGRGAAAGGAVGGGLVAASGITSSVARDIPRSVRAPAVSLPSYGGQSIGIPYFPPSTGGFTGRGPGGVYYGQIIPPGAPGGAGGPPTRGGPTIGGTAAAPGYAAYGPYGAPFAGQGIPGIPPPPGGGGPGGPGGGGPGGGDPGGPGWAQRAWGWRPNRHGSWKSAAVEMAIPAWMGGQFIESSFNKAADLQTWQKRLAGKGFTPEQVEAATRQSFQYQQGIKPTTVQGNMELLADINQVVQDPEDALALQKSFAKLQAAYSAAGNAGGEAQLMAAIKGGEFQGVLGGKTDPKTGKPTVDTTKLQGFIQNLLATYVAFGIEPSQELQFMRSAGYAGAILSDESLFARQAALIQALGAGGAGTALRGLSNQFASGKMGTATANLLLDMDILKGGGTVKTNPYVRKNGPFNVFIDPRAFPEGLKTEISEHPDQFIVKYLYPKIKEYLAKTLGKQYTGANARDQQIMEMQYSGQLASSQTGSKEIAETIRVIGLMDRDLEAWKEARQRPLESMLTQGNAKFSAEGMGASWGAFQTALGNAALKPAIEVLDSLTKELNMLADWANKNPAQAEKAFKGLAEAVGMFAAGSAAAVALGILTNPISGMVALAAGIKALGGSLTSLPTWLINSAAGAAAGARVAGAPGAVAGAVGGAAWSVGPDALNNTGWSPLHPFSLSHRGPDGQLHYSWENSSVAPTGAAPGGGDQKTLSVHVGSVSSEAARSLTTGIGGGMSNQLNRPPSGVTGHDATIDAVNGMFGNLGP